LFVAVLAFSTTTARAQRDAIIPDPDPEIERRALQVAEGFEINLFAADPVLAKPIQMNWDAAGRLWVASSETYPQVKPGAKPNDKILVLEDTDGDGEADKTTVFADGLFIPTGLAPGDGGAYVANSTELLHLSDKNGDGKADTRRVALDGFGTEDTHHIIHTFRWGVDSRLYFNQSIYIHSHVETPWGVERLGGGGFWRWKPDSMKLSVFARGLVNPWGHVMDPFGQSFGTDGAGGEGINWMIPGAWYFTAPGATRILAGLNPGSPKYCGLELVSGRHFPEDWQGNLITNDFRAHRVCRFVISDVGSGFAAREMPEVVKTTHPAFRPIDVQFGPDGALYIADWYNPIIQHGEVDFRDPRRDVTHGRIWRITAKNRPVVTPPRLVDAHIADLCEQLKAPEKWTRDQARRVLVERGASATLPAIEAFAARLDPADSRVDHHRLEALWVYWGLDQVEPTLLRLALESPDARIRAAAVRIIPDWADRLSEPLQLLERLVGDEHPRVRLEAIRALGAMPDDRAAAVALRAVSKPRDKFLDYALWLTMRDQEPRWLRQFAEGRLETGGDPERLAVALDAVDSAAAIAPVLSLLKAKKLADSDLAPVLALLARRGGRDDLNTLWTLVFEADRTPLFQRAVLEALDRLRVLFKSNDERIRASALILAGRWKLEPLRAELEAVASDAQRSEDPRKSAISALALLGGPESIKRLDTLAAGDASRAIREAATIWLVTLDESSAARHAVALFESASHQHDPTILVNALLSDKDGAKALSQALVGRSINPDIVKIAMRAVRSTGRAEPGLLDALAKAGHLTGTTVSLAPEARAALLRDVATSGDPKQGEKIFRRADLKCLSCHAIAGSGGRVGASLESIGASAQPDYLLEALLEPSKAIKEGYHAVVVATDDGKITSGIKIRESADELVLRDAEDREVSIPKPRIEESKPAGSLMPEGLADSLTRDELVHLLRFLSELGKVGSDYAVGPKRLARTWEVLAAESGNWLHHTGLDRALSMPEESTQLRWSSAYTTVAGELPLEDIPAVKILTDSGALGLARTRLEVSSPGAIRLAIDPEGLTGMWLDGKRVEPKREVDFDLTSGTHMITVAFDRAKRPQTPLGLELIDMPNSPARAQWRVDK
jgi:putative heme-binding domain-containing protein